MTSQQPTLHAGSMANTVDWRVDLAPRADRPGLGFSIGGVEKLVDFPRRDRGTGSISGFNPAGSGRALAIVVELGGSALVIFGIFGMAGRRRARGANRGSDVVANDFWAMVGQ